MKKQLTAQKLREEIDEIVGEVHGCIFNNVGCHEEETDQILSAVADWFLNLEEMREVRHITDTKSISNIVVENDGNVSWDEAVNMIQEDIDAQNELRSKLKSEVIKLKEKV